MLSLSITHTHHRRSRNYEWELEGESPLYILSVYSSVSEHNIKSAQHCILGDLPPPLTRLYISWWQCQMTAITPGCAVCIRRERLPAPIKKAMIVKLYYFFSDIMYLPWLSSEVWQPMPVDHQLWELFVFLSDSGKTRRGTFFDMSNR